MRRSDFDYHPFYCEENAWRLAADKRLQDCGRWIVFVTNRTRTCALWHQRAGEVGQPVVWDYHVLVVVRAQADLLVLDLDTTLDFPIALVSYLQQTFPHLSRWPVAYRPSFRVVAADAFLPRFASDRRHMKDDAGQWRQQPPPWPPIQGTDAPHDLEGWLDTSAAAPGRGRLATIKTLPSLFEAGFDD